MKKHLALIGLILGYGLLCLKIVPDYLSWETNVFIGLLMLPYVAEIKKGCLSRRFLVPVLIFSLLAIAVPARSTLFFMLLFSLLLLFENFIGKLSLAVLFILVIISPIFKFFSDTLSFPLRLWLSNLVADTMTFAGMQIKAAGNLISIGKYEFYIDQACAGLNMLHLSLLITVFIAAAYQKKRQSPLHFTTIFCLLLITFSLNIVSNYFRILMIVIFKIMPGNIFHDLAGLICMAIYVILPLSLFTGRFIKYFSRKNQISLVQSTGLTYPYRIITLHITLLLSLGILAFRPKYVREIPANDKIELAGYKKSIVSRDVIKLENKTALIYLKPTPFYAPEHNPMICWSGGGYEFKFIRKVLVKGTEIYMGTLEKGKEKIYAAWWFDNGVLKTTNQWNWRWQSAIKRESFYLVNVNAVKEEDLLRITEQLLPSPLAGNF